MKKKLTVYYIKYGKAPKAFIAIADNSIPLKIINYYADVESSFIYEEYISTKYFSLIKKICRNTGKLAILNRNHNIIKKFIDEIIGQDITLIQYSFKTWNQFFQGLQAYGLENKSIIEIDHPINLKDKMFILLVKEGLKSFAKSQIEYKKIGKSIKKKKKYGK